MTGSPGEVDLTNCDREPIHLLGRVQQHGFLLAFGRDWKLTHWSENLLAFLPDANPRAGLDASVFISSELRHDIVNRLQRLGPLTDVEHLLEVKLVGSDEKFDVSTYFAGEDIVLEFEPSLPGDLELDLADVRIASARLIGADSLEKMLSTTATFLQHFLGYDRVMIYRFLPDETGEVVAEQKRFDLEPYLGLRYPASDIPKQARQLYLRNLIRTIGDSSDVGAKILTSTQKMGVPIDLSKSIIRAVSPVHLEYLRNMGVGASMSISLVSDGRLWGLIACHNVEPFMPPLRRRQSALVLAQMLGLILQTKMDEKARALDSLVTTINNELAAGAASAISPFDLLPPSLRRFQHVVRAEGFAIVLDGQVRSEGSAPSANEILALAAELDETDSRDILPIRNLSEVHAGAAAFGKSCAGALIIPISRHPQDFLMFFRGELPEKITWAGDPRKPVEPDGNGTRLSPRKSFAAWKQQVEGQCEEWTAAEIRAAQQLRVTVLEVVLRYAAEASRERKAANDRQDLLIAELNHRVRNILGLVRGLVAQTKNPAISTAEYVNLLDSRIHALARAHDQLTSQNWSASSFHRMLETELAGFMLNSGERLKVSGGDALISPQAFSTVALVFHELMTNSAKYGALSDRHGRVDVDLASSDGGDLTIGWSELGGPAVMPPSRKGFGTTVIERSIPYELGGKAHIDYELSGVSARFVIPAQFVTFVAPSAKPTRTQRQTVARDRAVNVPARVLIVEDNLIIGLQAEDIFRELGSIELTVVSNVGAAMAALDSSEFDFALLDINLGNETSLPVGERLMADHVPFAFATGYGDSAKLPPAFDGIHRVAKPYSTDSLKAALGSHKR